MSEREQGVSRRDMLKYLTVGGVAAGFGLNRVLTGCNRTQNPEIPIPPGCVYLSAGQEVGVKIAGRVETVKIPDFSSLFKEHISPLQSVDEATKNVMELIINGGKFKDDCFLGGNLSITPYFLKNRPKTGVYADQTIMDKWGVVSPILSSGIFGPKKIEDIAFFLFTDCANSANSTNYPDLETWEKARAAAFVHEFAHLRQLFRILSNTDGNYAKVVKEEFKDNPLLEPEAYWREYSASEELGILNRLPNTIYSPVLKMSFSALKNEQRGFEDPLWQIMVMREIGKLHNSRVVKYVKENESAQAGLQEAVDKGWISFESLPEELNEFAESEYWRKESPDSD